MIYAWAGLPWTLLIERQYEPIHEMLKDGVKPEPIAVEVLNTLERALSYAHTGNARVLTKLMTEWWQRRALLTYGYPILHPNIVQHGRSRPCYMVNIFNWPIHSKTGRPVISSERTFMIEWGASSLSVSGYSLGQRRYVCDVRAPLRAYVMWSCMWRCRARASARARQLCPTRHISTDCRNDVRAQQRARDRSCVTYQHTH